MESKPAVEFAPQKEEESAGEPTWWVLGGKGLITSGLALVTMIPGLWETQVGGPVSRGKTPNGARIAGPVRRVWAAVLPITAAVH